MNKRVTLREVAKAADVSVGTASNVLNGSGRTAWATAKRVNEVAQKLGYTPDATISMAMSKIRQGKFYGHEEVLAFLTAYPNRDTWHQWFDIQNYWEGALERATELGYRLVEYWLGEKGITQARHSKILYNRGIRGLILAPHPDAEARLHLDWRHFAAIAISRSIKDPLTHRVLDDHAAIMRTAMLNLLARGYQRIGFAMNRHRVERTNDLWLGAYLACQQKLSPKNRLPTCIPEAHDQHQPCGPALLAWFKKHRPDAIVGIHLNDVEYLEKHGVRCPRDYGFAFINARPDDPRYAGVVHDSREVGRTAVSKLAGMLKIGETGLPRSPHITLLEGYWQDGKSIGKASKTTRRKAASKKIPVEVSG